MRRTARATEAGVIYHVLNRGNRRMRLFHKPGDHAALEQVLSEGLERYPVVCAQPGRPLGTVEWVQATADRLGLGFTLRSAGRPKKKASNQ